MGEAAGIGIERRRILGWCAAGAGLLGLPSRGLAVPDPVAPAEEPHHHVIFDNADLRLMRVMIPPGQATGWQIHGHDYVVAVLRGAQTRTETVGGTATEGEMVTDSVLFSAFEGQPVTNRILNTSTWLYHQIAFEILAPKPGGYGAADRGHEPAYNVVMDNPRVRGWRLRLQPGAYTAPAVQSGPGVRVVLSGGRVIDMPARGTGQETDVAAGDAAFLPPDTRSVINGGNGLLDMIEFEVR